MDKTKLVQEVAELFRLNGHSVETSVRFNHREIDVVAKELQGLIQKTILVECADYATPAGVEKVQGDIQKLEAAREELQESAILMIISRNGFTPDGAGYALKKGVTILSLPNLRSNLINFDKYIEYIEGENIRSIILNEYQSTSISNEGESRAADKISALNFLDDWTKLRSTTRRQGSK
jgi:hypothetical protein